VNALLVALLILRSQQSPPPAPPEVHEEIEVVAVTSVHGLGVPILLIPANVQVMSAADIDRRPGAPIGELLASHLASVHLNETQNNPFQPDVQFRGFTASPLLGSSQGVAIYVDGVRANEPFGDAMNWDLLPTNAIASANLVPGSNPLFGLNALGGALSLETKTGFSHPGHDASVFAGSFGRQWFDVTSGAFGQSELLRDPARVDRNRMAGLFALGPGAVLRQRRVAGRDEHVRAKCDRRGRQACRQRPRA